MWQRFVFILPLILSASSIKVPVDNVERAELTKAGEPSENVPIYYIKDSANVDSYLLPPDPHAAEQMVLDGLGSPATYLLPPSKAPQTFYIGEEPSAQSDWLPILKAQPERHRNSRYQRPPHETIPILFNPTETEQAQEAIQVPVPPTHLVPPSVDAVNEFFLPEAPEKTEVPAKQPEKLLEISKWPYLDDDRSDPTVYPQLTPVEPELALHLTPPKAYQGKKLPTKLYPKKYNGSFKPIPIPLAELDEKDQKVPKAKPAKHFKPPPSVEIEDARPDDDKKIYLFKKSENQRLLIGPDAVKKHHGDAAVETYGKPTSTEQETSETNFRYPGRPAYPVPQRKQQPRDVPQDNGPSPAAPAPDGRTEFRMHGMKGPHSYQFGYDTGKGKNRQFRYEERDNEGIVKGHYGYVDKLGKLRVVNYSAHPEYGFRAEEPVEKESSK